MLRSETPSAFVPANAGSEWFWIDVPALAAAAKLPPDTLLVEALAPPGHALPGTYPSVRRARRRLSPQCRAPADSRAAAQAQAEASLLHFSVTPDEHRNYAFTWFTLAAATGVIAALAVRSKRAELTRRAARDAARAGAQTAS